MSSHDSQDHILVLNSSEEFLQLMQSLLAEEGYKVSIDTKANEKLEEIAAMRPDLLIVDFLWVNDEAGWRLLQLVKLDPRTTKIPVILCTAGVAEVEALAPQLGRMHIEVVIKPFDLDDLLNAIRRQLGR
jgi:CheY-like chemotaxis protein